VSFAERSSGSLAGFVGYAQRNQRAAGARL